MTFDEWKQTRLPLADYGKATLVREAWEAATERAAQICDERAKRCAKQASEVWRDVEDVIELKAMAWQFSVLADNIRENK